MSLTLVLSREEFAAKRRTMQAEFEAALERHVERALDRHQPTDGWRELLNVMETLFAEAYADEFGEPPTRYPRGWRQTVLETLRKTNRPPTEHTVDRITAFLATNIISEATWMAALDDPAELGLEWVTMHDDDVRIAHRKVDGQVRPLGDPFDVDGAEMQMPGDVTAPIELWINCRCTVRPTPLEEAFAVDTAVREAAIRSVAFISEKSWDGSASRFTPEQWKKSCILHKCEGAEKSCHSLPIREPGGALSRAGVHAAAGRLNQVDAPAEAKASAKRALRGAYRQLGEEPPDSLTAAVETRTGTCVVALPNPEDAVHAVGDEQKHATILFLGDFDGDITEVQAAAEGVAGSMEPFDASVSGRGSLGPDSANVLFVEAGALQELRDRLLDNDTLREAAATGDSHPHFVPHVTITYGEDAPAEVTEVKSIAFDRLAVWDDAEQTEYPLGGGQMTDTSTEAPVATEPVEEANAVPWHGVLAPEGIASGDRRRFKEGSLTTRPLPLPLTWQKVSNDGHKGNVTVAKIERAKVIDGEMRASGHMLMTPEADEVIGLVSEFGRFGVSVDADESEFEVDEAEEMVDFTRARVSSACIVPIPAFAEAWVSLGEAPEDWFPDDEEEVDGEVPETVEREEEEVDDELVAAIEAMAARVTEEFVDTEDGPGWLTHPVDTDRLRDYWTKGPGAAKINWGTPGDFNRCRAQVAKYVKPQHLNGYCANRHYDALGFWPGRPVAGDTIAFIADTLHLENTDPADAISLVASGGWCAPSEWFRDQELEQVTPFTVTDDGQVFGHLAQWGECHIGFPEECQVAPQSKTAYAYFLTGEVALDNGTRCPVGQVTLGTGHAGGRLSMRAAMAHYDNTGTAVCDVTCGEDAHGIWVAGCVRPGTTDEQVHALMASPLSGDWRNVHGNLELCAALAVNVPGFPIPRIQVAASTEGQVSLVAAGMVLPPEPEPGVDIDAIATAVAVRLTEMQTRKAEMAALAASLDTEE